MANFDEGSGTRMIRFQADYFDGITARANRVEVRVVEQTLVIDEGGDLQTFALRDLAIQPRLGKTRRLVDLPDGGRLEADSLGGLEFVNTSSTSAFWRFLHYLESHLGWVATALVLSIAAGWAVIQYAVPALAQQVAYATPMSTETSLGEQVITAMDHRYGYFKPSSLAPARRNDIARALGNLCSRQVGGCPPHRLEFRDGGPIGANALALPGGIIVVTDQLVKLALNDREVIAVLAHEMGHVQNRHALRQTMQGALAGLVIVAFTGDLDSLASGLPAVLLQMSYSRALEAEADNFALAAIHNACIQPEEFANILRRLSAQGGGTIPEIISSHPDTNARIKPFQRHWTDCTK